MPEEARQRAAERRCSRAPLRTGALLEEPDELATRVVRGMGERADGRPRPSRCALLWRRVRDTSARRPVGSRALKLGLLRDESADSIVGGYAEDYVVQGGSEREEVLS